MAIKTQIPCESLFPTAKQDATHVAYDYGTPQSNSPSYRLAYDDFDFIMRDELRPVRLQLELLKPELAQVEHDIKSTVVIFGSARIPDYETAQKLLLSAEQTFEANPGDPELEQNVAIAHSILNKSQYYGEARKLGGFITQEAKKLGHSVVVVTGGPGMQRGTGFEPPSLTFQDTYRH